VIAAIATQMMPPFWRASAVNFPWRRSHKAMPLTINTMTARLKGLLMGTNTVSKVHSMNLAAGVMSSWRFMGAICCRENRHLSAC